MSVSLDISGSLRKFSNSVLSSPSLEMSLSAAYRWNFQNRKIDIKHRTDKDAYVKKRKSHKKKKQQMDEVRKNSSNKKAVNTLLWLSEDP